MIKTISVTLLSIIHLLTSHVSADVYSGLEFGDSRKVAIEKLKASSIVTDSFTDAGDAQESVFGNAKGLNGRFRCNTGIAGLTYHLYFGWTAAGELNQITLRSEGVAKEQYNHSINSAWEDAARILTTAYEKPLLTNTYPDISQLKSNQFLISHQWKAKESVNISLGTGLLEGLCFLAIRFSPNR